MTLVACLRVAFARRSSLRHLRDGVPLGFCGASLSRSQCELSAAPAGAQGVARTRSRKIRKDVDAPAQLSAPARAQLPCPDAHRRDHRLATGRPSRSSSSRRRPRRRPSSSSRPRARCASWSPTSSRSPTAPAARPARARSRSPRRSRTSSGFETMAHLSCVGETREGLAATLDRIAEAGIENVFALRGDPPRGRGGLRPARGRPRQRRRAGRVHLGGLGLHDRRRLLPRGPPRGPRPRHRPRLPEDEGRLRRLLPDHPALLRQPGLLRLRRRGAGAGDRGADPRRRHPGRQLRPDEADLRPLRRLDPGPAGSRVRRGRTATSGPSSSSASPTPPSSAPSCCSPGAPGIHFYALNRAPATRAVLGALRAARPWERGGGDDDMTGATAD